MLTLGEERVRLILQNLGKIWMVSRESGKEGGGERDRKPVLKGFHQGHLFVKATGSQGKRVIQGVARLHLCVQTTPLATV